MRFEELPKYKPKDHGMNNYYIQLSLGLYGQDDLKITNNNYRNNYDEERNKLKDLFTELLRT